MQPSGANCRFGRFVFAIAALSFPAEQGTETDLIMRPSIRRALAGLIVVFIFQGLPSARSENAAVLDMLGQPGVHAIMRHALAPGTGDPAKFNLNDCRTQRNLDSRGRDQARTIGKAMRDAGIVFDRVLTSQWCRCRETAELLDLGQPEDFPAINSFFRDRSTAGDQTRAVLDFLSALPEDKRLMLVTHQVNITALTGMGVSSGEVFFVRIDRAGDLEVVGRFLLSP